MFALPLLACLGTADPTPDAQPVAPQPEVEAPPVPSDPGSQLLAELRSKPLTTTRHAECRMDCRHVSLPEIEALLVDGIWIPERSREDGPCESHAIEGTSADGQELRVVYAACDSETRVVTAIDLGREWPCDCD
ncbi:MAG: DUF4258 domain-containing protein [Proteobacteria bacterium]|nr:DUF4258 domain-containing protein [Pseudomonadota bacterium]